MAVVAIGVAIAQTPTPTPDPKATPAPATLQVSWRFDLTAAGEGRSVLWLVPGDTRVFLSGPGQVVNAHDAADGRVVWSSTEPVVVPPVITGTNLVLVGATKLAVVQQSSGKTMFSAPFEGKPSLAFSTTDRVGVVLESSLQAWDMKGAPAWTAKFSGSMVTNVVTTGSLVVFGTDQPALLAIDAAGGATAWTVPLPTKPSPLVASAERIYFGGADGALYSFRTTGEPKHAWRTKRPRSVGQPVVDKDSVYFALLDNSVRAFGAGGGTERWDQVVEWRPSAGPMRLTDSLAVALTNGRIAELSPKTGKLVGPTAADPKGSVRLLAAGASPDGTRVYTLTIAGEQSRGLVAWGRR